jgi:hypothetical protein
MGELAAWFGSAYEDQARATRRNKAINESMILLTSGLLSLGICVEELLLRPTPTYDQSQRPGRLTGSISRTTNEEKRKNPRRGDGAGGGKEDIGQHRTHPALGFGGGVRIGST